MRASDEPTTVERPLRARLQLAITAAVLLFGLLNVALVGRIAYGALRAEQDRRLSFVARLLAQRAARPLLVDDQLDLQKLLDESRGLDPDLAFVVVFDRHGRRAAQSASLDTLSGLPSDVHPAWAGPARYREAIAPVLDGKLGQVHVGVLEASLRGSLARIVGVIAAMVLAFLAVGVAAAAAVARSVTRPLERLVAFTSSVRLEGPLPQLELDRRDEIAEVGRHLVASATELQGLHGEARRRERELARVEHLAVVGTLAAGAAHEINNPLAGLRTALERLLRQARDPDEAAKYGAVLRDAIARIEAAVRGLLSFARATEVTVERVKISEVVERALELAAPRLEQARISLVRDIGPRLPPVLADAGKLTQVLVNLVLNACDAMPPGGELAIRVVVAGHEATVDVSDTGPGVPEEISERVFDPFFTTKAQGKGTGLGLAVSRTGVREMGGDLQLLPSETGATFRIRLQVATGGADVAHPAG
jgi:two-component system NtrC family sensor kinase